MAADGITQKHNKKKIRHKRVHMIHFRRPEMGGRKKNRRFFPVLCFVKSYAVLPSFAKHSFIFVFCFLFFTSNTNSAMQTHKLITNKCLCPAEHFNGRIYKQLLLNFFTSLTLMQSTLVLMRYPFPFMIATNVQCAFSISIQHHSEP